MRGRQANAEAQAEQLQREQLAGQKKEVANTASQENAAYKLLVRQEGGGGGSASQENAAHKLLVRQDEGGGWGIEGRGGLCLAPAACRNATYKLLVRQGESVGNRGAWGGGYAPHQLLMQQGEERREGGGDYI